MMTGPELKAARLAWGLSAQQLAHIIGAVDDAHVRKWERTNPPTTVQIMVRAMLDSPAVAAHFGLPPVATSDGSPL